MHLTKNLPKAFSLVDMLHGVLGGKVPARPYTTIRASAVTKQDLAFCPREVAILDLKKQKPKDEYIAPATKVAFEQGESLHHLARNNWLRSVAIGDWKCPMCGHKHYFTLAPKADCPKCGMKGSAFLYSEVEIKSEHYIWGNLDLIIDEGLDKHCMVEIKTIDKDQFKELKMPLAEHRLRTNLYLELIRTSTLPEKDHINQDYARILYISKGYGAKNDDGKVSPFREFKVSYELSLLKPYIEKAQLVKLFRETGKIPKRICPSAMGPRVKACSVGADCWSATYPEGAVCKFSD
jgi:hypothetical protein